MKPLKPTPGQFVVRTETPADPKMLARRLSAAAVEPLAGDPNALVATFDTRQAADEIALARKLRNAAGAGARIFPVLHDANGTPAFPTGRVVVRFKKAAQDKALRDFADKHRLELVRRNEFQPEQAIFEPKKRHRRTLTESVAEASADGDVELAWPEAKSAYKKA